MREVDENDLCELTSLFDALNSQFDEIRDEQLTNEIQWIYKRIFYNSFTWKASTMMAETISIPQIARKIHHIFSNRHSPFNRCACSKFLIMENRRKLLSGIDEINCRFDWKDVDLLESVENEYHHRLDENNKNNNNQIHILQRKPLPISVCERIQMKTSTPMIVEKNPLDELNELLKEIHQNHLTNKRLRRIFELRRILEKRFLMKLLDHSNHQTATSLWRNCFYNIYRTFIQILQIGTIEMRRELRENLFQFLYSARNFFRELICLIEYDIYCRWRLDQNDRFISLIDNDDVEMDDLYANSVLFVLNHVHHSPYMKDKCPSLIHSNLLQVFLTCLGDIERYLLFVNECYRKVGMMEKENMTKEEAIRIYRRTTYFPSLKQDCFSKLLVFPTTILNKCCLQIKMINRIRASIETDKEELEKLEGEDGKVLENRIDHHMTQIDDHDGQLKSMMNNVHKRLGGIEKKFSSILSTSNLDMKVFPHHSIKLQKWEIPPIFRTLKSSSDWLHDDVFNIEEMDATETSYLTQLNDEELKDRFECIFLFVFGKIVSKIDVETFVVSQYFLSLTFEHVLKRKLSCLNSMDWWENILNLLTYIPFAVRQHSKNDEKLKENLLQNFWLALCEMLKVTLRNVLHYFLDRLLPLNQQKNFKEEIANFQFDKSVESQLKFIRIILFWLCSGKLEDNWLYILTGYGKVNTDKLMIRKNCELIGCLVELGNMCKLLRRKDLLILSFDSHKSDIDLLNESFLRQSNLNLLHCEDDIILSNILNSNHSLHISAIIDLSSDQYQSSNNNKEEEKRRDINSLQNIYRLRSIHWLIDELSLEKYINIFQTTNEEQLTNCEEDERFRIIHRYLLKDNESVFGGESIHPINSSTSPICHKIINEHYKSTVSYQQEIRLNANSVLLVCPLYLVIDTNCFIQDLDLIRNLFSYKYYHMIVPIMVLHEVKSLTKLTRDVREKNLPQNVEDKKKSEERRQICHEILRFFKEQIGKNNDRAAYLNERGELLLNPNLKKHQNMVKGENNDDRILTSCYKLVKRMEEEGDHINLFRRNNNNNNINGCDTISKPCRVVLLTNDKNLRLKGIATEQPTKRLKDFLRWTMLPDKLIRGNK
ncbi:hypothetical protein SNEBB_001267 [Seison nebaliae]|nr:hypothetical protein SNEBB_001267 [Seison nebaliae]